jgi:hypothetical protein
MRAQRAANAFGSVAPNADDDASTFMTRRSCEQARDLQVDTGPPAWLLGSGAHTRAAGKGNK